MGPSQTIRMMAGRHTAPINCDSLAWVTPPHPYPPGYEGLSDGKEVKHLAQPFGLENFSVALVRLQPGVHDALRHWHGEQDEFVYMMNGVLTLVTESGEQDVTPGQCIGFRAGVTDGHMLENRSDRSAMFMVVVGVHQDEVVTFSDHDLVLEDFSAGPRWLHKDGSPYS